MKTELTDQSLQEILDWVRETGDIMREQGPVVAQEIVTWVRFQSSGWVLVYGTAALAVLLLGRQMKEKGRVTGSSRGHDLIVFGWLMLAPAAMFATFAVACAIDIVKTFVAPRLVVLDYIQGMLS